MNRRWNLGNVLVVISASVLCLVSGCNNASKPSGDMGINMDMGDTAAPEEPAEGIRITLSVYSGRPNPEWWVTEGPLYEKLVDVTQKLKTSRQASFDYGQWNRLGYASFWIRPKNVKGLSYDAIHIWRNMACVFQNAEGARLYADDAGELYDLLVGYAEQNKQGAFFENYHKSRKR